MSALKMDASREKDPSILTMVAQSGYLLYAVCLCVEQPWRHHLAFLFGTQWTGPLVIMVLGVFTLGVIVGVLGMLPKWWRHRRALKKMQDAHTNLLFKPHHQTPPKAPLPSQRQPGLEPSSQGLQGRCDFWSAPWNLIWVGFF
jgi:uncharacterized integral membrane protein